jgi:hypothetical protein
MQKVAAPRVIDVEPTEVIVLVDDEPVDNLAAALAAAGADYTSDWQLTSPG